MPNRAPATATPATVPPPPIGMSVASTRLLLRAPQPADVPEVRRLMRKNAEHLRPWSPLPPSGEDPSSLTALSKAVLAQRREWKQGESFIFFVTTTEPGEPIIGRVALTGIMRRAFQNAYLGYWIDEDRQKRGLMTEAVRLAVNFAFWDAKLHRVQAAVMPRNLGSLRLLEKLGFRREGLSERYLQIAGKWEDHLIHAVTSEEWEITQP